MIISADIGGTKTSIGISEEKSPITYIRKKTYMNSDFTDFIDIVKEFSKIDEISIMVLGIAGPISGRIVDLTNLDWSIDADILEEEFECRVYLLNDLQAAAHSIPYLQRDDINPIYKGGENKELNQNIEVIVSVGTGLGVAKIFQSSEKIVFPSEGGHIGFTPHSKFQQEFFDFVNKSIDHVSYEMMVSSIGFKNLRNYLLNANSMELSGEFLSQLKETSDISRLLLKNADLNANDAKICKFIIEQFSQMLGSYLGDMVLVHLPKSIYLTGGIGRNVPVENPLKDGFLSKANMTHVVEKCNLVMITEPDCALHGTSWFASEHL